MKKYLSKALLYKEWKAVYWIIIPLVLFGSKALEISNFVQGITEYKVVHTAEDGYNLFFVNFNLGYHVIELILVVVMAYLISNNDRKESVSAFVKYMPFTKRQRIFSKAVIGVVVIFISNFISFLINMFMFLINEKYLKQIIRIRYIIFYFIITLMLYSIIYLFILSIQLVCRNSFFAMLLAVSILNLPASIESILSNIFYRKPGGVEIIKVIDKLNNLSIQGYFRIWPNEKIANGKEYMQGDSLLLVSTKLLILLIITIALLRHISKGIKVGEDVMIKTSSKKEMAFKIFSSVSIGILFAKGLSTILSSQFTSSNYLIIINVLFILAAYFAYSRIDRIIKLSKYDRGE